MLTKRQKQILDYITKCIKENDYAPSLEEIKRHFRLSSVSTIHQHIEALRGKEYLEKIENQPRSIELSHQKKHSDLIRIPLLGTIAAGEPIEAIEDRETIKIPKSQISKSGEHYALRVQGDSMIDEGIFDGDTVVIRKQPTAENGETVVALINDNEVTLKKIYREKNGFRLQPANPTLRPIFTKEIVIQGKVISVIRTFKELKIGAKTFRVVKQKAIKKFEFDKIICGDVLEKMAEIPNNSIDLAITSPPYNVGKDYDNHFDKMKYQEYLDWLEKVWQETKRVLVPGGRFALNIAPTGIKDFVPLHHDFTNQFRKLGMKFRTEIIWYKQTMLKRTAWGSFKSPSNPHIVPSWEYVLIFSKDKDKLDGSYKKADITKDEFMKFSDGMWRIQPERRRKGHPAPFPEELIYRLIKFYSYKNNNVLDMFGGTGTVAAVAVKTGRHFVHIDISPQYCKTAQERVNTISKQQKLIINRKEKTL